MIEKNTKCEKRKIAKMPTVYGWGFSTYFVVFAVAKAA